MSADSHDLSTSAHSAPPSTQDILDRPSTHLNATDATHCNLSPTENTDPNPVPPERRGIYIFPPTKPLRRNPDGPIRADQESYDIPFRPDSAIASIPVRIPKLSDHQLNAIQLLLAGQTESAIARILQIDRATIWRWKTHHPLFKSELSRRRKETFSAAGDRFRKHLFAALKHLRRQLDDANALTSFRAARCLLYAAGSKHFAPPDEPTDPQAYLDTFTHARRKEIHSPDIENDPATHNERESALATLLAKCEDPALPPPGMNPTTPTTHPLGTDDDPGASDSQGSD